MVRIIRGNSLDNTLTGHSPRRFFSLTFADGVDHIYGYGGSDILRGLGGNDALYGGSGHDELYGGRGDDRLYGNSEHDDLYGGAGDDALFGGEGHDRLDGGSGDDFMAGGEGDDQYVVDSRSDQVYELAGQGRDQIDSSVDIFQLSANVEFLSLRGSAKIGVGNELDNSITGNAATNILNGGDGDDRLSGLAGADILVGGSGDDRLYGGEADDALIGGHGDDTLVGDAGNDVLTGGRGQDVFQYGYLVLFPADRTEDFGIDTIRDFTPGTDTLKLYKSDFQAIKSEVGRGFSDPSDFARVSSDLVQIDTLDAAIVYSGISGKLYYNENGSDAGFGTGGHLLTLTNSPHITATDFDIAGLSF